MKPNEITIGNWVWCGTKMGQVKEIFMFGNVSACEDLEYFIKLENMLERDSSESGDSERTVPIGEIRPIPLTMEILEKNGIPNKFRNLDVDTTINRKVRNVYDNWEIQRYGWRMVEIRYVHELQNVMNVLKIDREVRP